MPQNRRRTRRTGIRLLGLLLMLAGTGFAEEPQQCTGQELYVPVYSHIYVGNRELPFDLSANLSFRNTDPHHALTVHTCEYYNSDGKMVRSYLDAPMTVPPMASKYIFIKSSDQSGGWGANFIVKWQAETKMNPPIVESVMVGLRGSHSISFVSRGRVLSETRE